MAMTWNEFKTEVERIMERDGISKDMEIDYIDVVDPRPAGTCREYHSLFVICVGGEISISN